MKNKILILSILLSLPFLCFAEKPGLWEQKIKASIQYQNKIAEILLNKAPELEELIIISRDLQITMLKMKQEKFLYLTINDPNRIDPNKGLFSEWTMDDEIKLTKSNKLYKSLKKKKEFLKTKNQAHPMWPKLRGMFNIVRETEEYRNITKELRAY